MALAWGVVVLFVFFILVAFIPGLRRKVHPGEKKLVFKRAAVVLWVILLAASLAAALFVPRP